MGTGAVLPYAESPAPAAASRTTSGHPPPRRGPRRSAAGYLQQLVPAADGGVVSGVQRPAEIVNYRSMGTAPAMLAAALAVGALSSLWLTLMAVGPPPRKELALLKTLGFTRRQVAAAVAWLSTAAVAVGAAVGVPLGIALGRFLWDLFARQISVVPEPTVPSYRHPRDRRRRDRQPGGRASWPGRGPDPRRRCPARRVILP